MPQMQALTEAGLLEDLDASLAHLAAAGFPAPAVGVVGFCMGGSVAFLAAARRALGAAVTFYGGGVAEGRFGMPPLVEMAPGLATPWLGLFGDEDQGIPVDQVEALRTAAAPAGVDTEIVRYADAGHGFHCDARPDSYHRAAAEDGWRRTLDWFGPTPHLSPGGAGRRSGAEGPTLSHGGVARGHHTPGVLGGDGIGGDGSRRSPG